MCSVVGCYQGCGREQLFRLPEDVETRLAWVQFLATANEQRFKESSCMDISICIRHFKDDCFENHWASTDNVHITLKPKAVPSVSIKMIESGEPVPHLESQKCEEPLENIDIAKHNQLKTGDDPTYPEEPKPWISNEAQDSATPRIISCYSEAEVSHCQHSPDKAAYKLEPPDSTTSCSEESKPASLAAKGSRVRIGFSSATDSSDAFMSIHENLQPNNVSTDLTREKAACPQTKGIYIVNEKLHPQLFNPKCPSCGCKLQMEKVTHRGLIVYNAYKCPQCECRNQWKSQVNATFPTDEDQQPAESIYVIQETQQVTQSDHAYSSTTEVPQSVNVGDVESDHMEESEESSFEGDDDSDEDWNPTDQVVLENELQEIPEKGSDSEEEKNDDEDGDANDRAKRKLCTDCGRFCYKRSHTCEHKIKLFSCNICGKRCTNKVTLKLHMKIHSEDYVHPCKFCCVTFKTKADKITHERTHSIGQKPYKCPDCSERFATYKKQRIHLKIHKDPPQYRCSHCGMEFKSEGYLQRHLFVHTGEKPHKCSVCQRGFNQASHLKSHMRMHTGEKPFQCQCCDKSFNHNVSLKSHVQRYHTAKSGGEQNNSKQNKTSTNKRVADSGHGNSDEEQDTMHTEEIHIYKYNRRSIGRPKGIPNDQKTVNKTRKQPVQKAKRKKINTKESEDEPSDSNSDMFVDAAEEEENRGKKTTRQTTRSRRRVKKC
ncbi:zinc finger protein 85-like [Notolabrus celidotus]|uniref:zinc finger protein 85-like n=1 Tax=Notolabrus celidotus TaxID=1203425 RepID=UPI00149023B5|nr:zinc finger protein 85-like [Notolabrus celidotus]